MVFPSVVTAFFLLLALYTLMLAYRRGHWWLFALAGGACGVAPYWFIPNRTLGFMLVVWFAYLAVFQLPWLRRQWWKVLTFVAACTLVALPLALFWLHSPDQFMVPVRHVGIMYNLSYWAGQHPGVPTTAWNVLSRQVPPALGMFVVNGGPFTPWGGTFAPAMDVVTGWLLLPAVAFAFYRWRRPLVALVLIWGISIWFFGVVLTIDAPQMEHAVGAIPAVFLLIALLLDAIGGALIRKTGRPVLYAAAAVLLVLLSGALNFNAYFQDWGPQLAGANGFDWQFYDAANYTNRHATPRGTAIYSWGYPDEVFRFLSPQAHEFPGDARTFRPASLYIVIAGASVSPDQIAARVPGSRQEAVRDADGDLAFTAILPPTP
jgi:hypothetical protein